MEWIVEAESYSELLRGEWTLRREIVLCKDCKYHEYHEGHHTCEWHGFADVKPDWFCADGERKNDV